MPDIEKTLYGLEKEICLRVKKKKKDLKYCRDMIDLYDRRLLKSEKRLKVLNGSIN